MEGSEEGGQALKINNGGERSPKMLIVQGGRRVFIGGEKMAVGSSPPASSAVSPAAPASGPDGPAEFRRDRTVRRVSGGPPGGFGDPPKGGSE
jgi:hypothetical protein